DGGASEGGTSSGGKASGGTSSGTGGTGNASDGCEALCARAVAECPGASASDCREDCELAGSKPECEDAANAFFACTEDAELVCDDGAYEFPDCEDEGVALLICTFSDPTIQPLCEDYCARADEAQCPDAQPVEDCEVGCSTAVSLV